MIHFNQFIPETCYEYFDNGEVDYVYDEFMEYTYIIGNSVEIKAVYRSLVKANERYVFSPNPYFLDFPKFNPERMYGIAISWNGIEPYHRGINNDATFQIIGEEVVIDVLAEEFEKEKYNTDICDVDDLEDPYDWDYDYESNMPCDSTGYCAGLMCPIYYRCMED